MKIESPNDFGVAVIKRSLSLVGDSRKKLTNADGTKYEANAITKFSGYPLDKDKKTGRHRYDRSGNH